MFSRWFLCVSKNQSNGNYWPFPVELQYLPAFISINLIYCIFSLGRSRVVRIEIIVNVECIDTVTWKLTDRSMRQVHFDFIMFILSCGSTSRSTFFSCSLACRSLGGDTKQRQVKHLFNFKWDEKGIGKDEKRNESNKTKREQAMHWVSTQKIKNRNRWKERKNERETLRDNTQFIPIVYFCRLLWIRFLCTKRIKDTIISLLHISTNVTVSSSTVFESCSNFSWWFSCWIMLRQRLSCRTILLALSILPPILIDSCLLFVVDASNKKMTYQFLPQAKIEAKHRNRFCSDTAKVAIVSTESDEKQRQALRQ